MSRIPRRDALKLIGLMAAAPSAVLSGGLSAAPLPPIVPPAGPCLFTRRIARGLSDGKSITVTRVWRIVFAPAGPGFQIDGEQTSVEVLAPEGLEALVRLEEQRAEEGMFPMLLSAEGLLVGEDQPALASVVDEAIALAQSRIRSSALPADAQRASRQFLGQLDNSANQAISRQPRDLIFPRELSRSEERDFAVPGMEAGSVSVAFSAETFAGSRLLKQASRIITTNLGASSRRTCESWAIERL